MMPVQLFGYRRPVLARPVHRPQPRFGTESTGPVEGAVTEQALLARLDAAKTIARKAGQVIMKHYNNRDMKVGFKADQTIVTLADEEANRLIEDALKTRFPQDAIVTEESFQTGQARFIQSGWIIDPLDGTRNFATKVGPFAVAMAYVHQGEVKVGVIYDPVRKELFTAMRGKGAFLNNRPIQVSSDTALSKTSIVSTFHPPTAKVVETKAPARRMGCTAIDMAYVASGRYVSSCERNLKSWDIAAGIPILLEAGGQVSDLKGAPLDLTQEKVSYLASNGKLHSKMIELLN